jgi:hypothetical protein
VGQDEIERAALLLAGHGCRARPDREDEQEEGRQQREDLAVQVAGRARKVELAACEERADGLGQVSCVLAKRGIVAH